jgi:hypothetical protein
VSHLPCLLTISVGRVDATPAFLNESRLLSSLKRRRSDDGDVGTAIGFLAEGYESLLGSEDRVILAKANAGARMPLGPALTQDNVAGNDSFAAELLDAEASTRGIATVARRTACLFVCHDRTPDPLLGAR